MNGTATCSECDSPGACDWCGYCPPCAAEANQQGEGYCEDCIESEMKEEKRGCLVEWGTFVATFVYQFIEAVCYDYDDR